MKNAIKYEQAEVIQRYLKCKTQFMEKSSALEVKQCLPGHYVLLVHITIQFIKYKTQLDNFCQEHNRSYPIVKKQVSTSTVGCEFGTG